MTSPTLSVLEPGIYFGLDEHIYREDSSLGSTDLRRLRRNPSDYWWGSKMNPKRPEDKETDATIRGTALHKLVLQGEEAFDAIYMRGANHEPGMKPSEKTKLTKAANELAAERGLICLKATDYDRIAIASAMIMQNPELKTAFENGAAEVSIFWTRGDGVPRKARLDYLKVRGIGDLKGIANWRGMEFEAACEHAFYQYRYDVQVKHYCEARAQIPRLLADRLVHGDHDADFLHKVAAQPRFGWQFVFFQMEEAPITDSFTLTPEQLDGRTGEVHPGNPILDIANRTIEIATENYRKFLAEFGTSQWVQIKTPRELRIEDAPRWWDA